MNDHINIVPATLDDYPTIQNMARFYIYDLSRTCGFISNEWEIPADGLYYSFDFKIYFKDPTRKAYFITIANEIAGFVLLNQIGMNIKTTWNMGEFFILAKFQGRGFGRSVAHMIWDMHPGVWEVSVIPQNTSALSFWRKTIDTYTNDKFGYDAKEIMFDPNQPKRLVFIFNTQKKH